MRTLLAAIYLCSPLLLGGCIVEDHDRGAREHDYEHEHHDHDFDRDRDHDHEHDRDWDRPRG